LLIAFGLVDGSFIAFGSVLGLLFAGIFSTSKTSVVCGITTLLGIGMSFVSGIIIQRKKKFRLMMRLSCIGTTIVLWFGAVIWGPNHDTVLTIAVLSLGIVIVPIIPVGINFSGELAFPVEPTVVTGTLMMTGQIAGFFLAVGAGPLLTAEQKHLTIAMFAVCATIAAIMSLIIEEDLRRINFSKQNV
jgi:hypothetical protein